jgi:alkylation response protein AidB-like acyl-CoA dehydrogenase
MFEWTDEQRMIRDAVRQFVEAEIAPRREEFEFGDTPPYDVLRTMYRTFGLDAMARETFKRRLDRSEARAAGTCSGATTPPTPRPGPTASPCR